MGLLKFLVLRCVRTASNVILPHHERKEFDSNGFGDLAKTTKKRMFIVWNEQKWVKDFFIVFEVDY